MQSCGEMMFNPSTLVCDWPARVMQLRPECRDAEQLGLHKYPFHRARWPYSRAANDYLNGHVFTIMKNSPTSAFFWLKALSHLRHY